MMRSNPTARAGEGRGSGPGARRSAYITPEGFARMQAEYENLWKVERPKVTEAVSIAAALGDRSENADYIYGKKRLREIDSRMRFLQKRLDELTVVTDRPESEQRIYFGAWVTLEDEAGGELLYRIVGPDESDASQRAISMDSPMGRALLGKQVDDEIVVRRPRGTGTFTVLEIHYDEPADV